MSDPASLNVSVSVQGMSLAEAMALMGGMSSGARWEGVASRPALGPMRYAATVSGLSIKGARDLTLSLLGHVEYVSEHGTVPPRGSAEERSDDPSKASDLGEVS